MILIVYAKLVYFILFLVKLILKRDSSQTYRLFQYTYLKKIVIITRITEEIFFIFQRTCVKEVWRLKWKGVYMLEGK